MIVQCLVISLDLRTVLSPQSARYAELRLMNLLPVQEMQNE